MINFKQPEERLPSTLIVLALLTLLGTLIFALAVPAPSATVSARGREMSRRKLEEEIDTAKARTAQLNMAARTRLWNGDADAVAASVLDVLTAQTNQRKLKLSAFRPQRPQTLDGVTELPFSAQISGPFPAVQATISALESASSRLAVRSVQVASSDARTSAVTATLSLSAYVPVAAAEPPKKASPGIGTSTAAGTAGDTRQ